MMLCEEVGLAGEGGCCLQKRPLPVCGKTLKLGCDGGVGLQLVKKGPGCSSEG